MVLKLLIFGFFVLFAIKNVLIFAVNIPENPQKIPVIKISAQNIQNESNILKKSAQKDELTDQNVNSAKKLLIIENSHKNLVKNIFFTPKFFINVPNSTYDNRKIKYRHKAILMNSSQNSRNSNINRKKYRYNQNNVQNYLKHQKIQNFIGSRNSQNSPKVVKTTQTLKESPKTNKNQSFKRESSKNKLQKFDLIRNSQKIAKNFTKRQKFNKKFQIIQIINHKSSNNPINPIFDSSKNSQNSINTSKIPHWYHKISKRSLRNPYLLSYNFENNVSVVKNSQNGILTTRHTRDSHFNKKFSRRRKLKLHKKKFKRDQKAWSSKNSQSGPNSQNYGVIHEKKPTVEPIFGHFLNSSRKAVEHQSTFENDPAFGAVKNTTTPRKRFGESKKLFGTVHKEEEEEITFGKVKENARALNLSFGFVEKAKIGMDPLEKAGKNKEAFGTVKVKSKFPEMDRGTQNFTYGKVLGDPVVFGTIKTTKNQVPDPLKTEGPSKQAIPRKNQLVPKPSNPGILHSATSKPFGNIPVQPTGKILHCKKKFYSLDPLENNETVLKALNKTYFLKSLWIQKSGEHPIFIRHQDFHQCSSKKFFRMQKSKKIRRKLSKERNLQRFRRSKRSPLNSEQVLRRLEGPRKSWMDQKAFTALRKGDKLKRSLGSPQNNVEISLETNNSTSKGSEDLPIDTEFIPTTSSEEEHDEFWFQRSAFIPKPLESTLATSAHVNTSSLSSAVSPKSAESNNSISTILLKGVEYSVVLPKGTELHFSTSAGLLKGPEAVAMTPKSTEPNFSTSTSPPKVPDSSARSPKSIELDFSTSAGLPKGVGTSAMPAKSIQPNISTLADLSKGSEASTISPKGAELDVSNLTGLPMGTEASALSSKSAELNFSTSAGLPKGLETSALSLTSTQYNVLTPGSLPKIVENSAMAPKSVELFQMRQKVFLLLKNHFLLKNLTFNEKVSFLRSLKAVNHTIFYLLPKIKRSERRKNMPNSKNLTQRRFDSSAKLVGGLIPGVKFNKNGKKELHTKLFLLGLFELSDTNGVERVDGKSELFAAKLAVKHVNEKNILKGYVLELLTNDTQCDPGVGVDRFFHALYTQKATPMVMLLGSACNDVTESLAKVVPYWNIVQVSFGSTSPALSDRQEFPLFYRTVAPDSSHNSARIAFVQKFKWDTVSAISQNGDTYSLALNELVTELEQANITCTATITFSISDLADQLKTLRDLDTRIIIGSFSQEVAPTIFCEAYSLGMYGADYVWIVQGSEWKPHWWQNYSKNGCPAQNLKAAIDGLILVNSHNSIVGQNASFSGLTNEMFASEFRTQNLRVSKFAPQSYDAVWAIALALNGAEKKFKDSKNLTTVGDFDYTRSDMATEFIDQLGKLYFLGVSGPVFFNGADRVGTSAFHQIQDGVLKMVALYYPTSSILDFECPGCSQIIWKGDKIPIARRIFKFKIVTISSGAFLAISSLAVIGMVVATAFLAFNLHHRRLKSIKLSSPRLNNMTAIGCILVYAAVILLGLDHATLTSSSHFSAVCTARVYLLSTGFSLAFGSMFAKTYRVHRIFIKSRNVGFIKDRLLRDNQLMTLTCVLLLIDVLLASIWFFIDPMQRHLKNLPIELSLSEPSVVYQPQVEVCHSYHSYEFLSALYVYKGLLLIGGVYFAWETRHVKIAALNDSQYIGISVYSVVITTGIVVVLANLTSDKATLSFVTVSTSILITTTSTLCLLFIPKIHDIRSKKDISNEDPVTTSLGLRLECNTRRFVTDDRRELQYRVEVQNKVYRREVAALDLEIGRLEKQLQEAISISVSSSTSSVKKACQRNPSISGGLPLLLLSVLPPVIPRASWPSAAPNNRAVTFRSEPKLDENMKFEPQNLEFFFNQKPKIGVFGKIRNFFGSRVSIRKSSASSYVENMGIASALRAHVGYLTNLVPGVTKSSETVWPTRGSGPIISISQFENEPGPSRRGSSVYGLDSRRLSMAQGSSFEFSSKNVKFNVPSPRRKSIVHQNSQPVLSTRIPKGSPRFPHRIVPTSSLTALDAKAKINAYGSSRKNSYAPSSSTKKGLETKWKSMEDAMTSLPSGSRRGSGVLALSVLPLSSSSSIKTRAASYSPNCDVWSTAEFGIPLSEVMSKSMQ